jgi:hypothetical protein
MIQFQVIFVTWAWHKYVTLQSARMELFALNLDVMRNTAVGLCFYFFYGRHCHALRPVYHVCASI